MVTEHLPIIPPNQELEMNFGGPVRPFLIMIGMVGSISMWQIMSYSILLKIRNAIQRAAAETTVVPRHFLLKRTKMLTKYSHAIFKSGFLKNVAFLTSGSALAQFIVFACSPIISRLYLPHQQMKKILKFQYQHR